MKDPRFPDWLEFFPQLPTDEKTRQLQTIPSPFFEGQTAPFEARALADEIEADIDAGVAKYVDTRFTVTGIVRKVGLDMHNLPSIQLSDKADGECCAACIFPADHGIPEVSVGDRVTICANYLVYSHPLGVVMKLSELVKAEK